ncbi:MAG: MerR family DNA-binding protein [Microthrixaceae bacterium]
MSGESTDLVTRPESRRLVFIGMLQDAGLSLEEIIGVLDAPDNATWKAIGRERLDALSAEIDRLAQARDYLGGALLCRFDHPLVGCQVMGGEIDRRLELAPPQVTGPRASSVTRRTSSAKPSAR